MARPIRRDQNNWKGLDRPAHTCFDCKRQSTITFRFAGISPRIIEFEFGANALKRTRLKLWAAFEAAGIEFAADGDEGPKVRLHGAGGR